MPDNTNASAAPARIHGVNIAWREADVVFGFSKENYLTLAITRRYLVPTEPITKVILHEGKLGPIAMLTIANERGFEIVGTIKVPHEIFYSVRTATAEITERAGNVTRTYEVPVGAPANGPDTKVSVH